jgi:hypothetical protein
MKSVFLDINDDEICEGDYFTNYPGDRILNQLVWVKEHNQYMGYQVGTLGSLFGIFENDKLLKTTKEEFETNYKRKYKNT